MITGQNTMPQSRRTQYGVANLGVVLALLEHLRDTLTEIEQLLADPDCSCRNLSPTFGDPDPTCNHCQQQEGT